MKKEIAEILVDYNGNLQIYEDYSGRGMYGKTTYGIQCDDVKDFLDAVGEYFFEMILDAKDEGDDYDTEMAKELKDALSNYQYDSLGMGYIVY